MRVLPGDEPQIKKRSESNGLNRTAIFLSLLDFFRREDRGRSAQDDGPWLDLWRRGHDLGAAHAPHAVAPPNGHGEVTSCEMYLRADKKRGA